MATPFPQQGLPQMQGPPQGGPGMQGPQMGGGAPDPSQMPPGPPQGPGMGEDSQNSDISNESEQQENYINAALASNNLAKKFKDKDDKDGKDILTSMGAEVVKGFDNDQRSRQEWLDNAESALELATLVRTARTFPWPKASNVKYPLLATAAMQFSARAYPALVPSDGNIVKTKIMQQNPQDETYAAARRISDHMSYQLLESIPNWEEEMDRLLMTMAITGIVFKKTYHSDLDECHRSDLISAENLCVNYHAKSLEQAYRKTELLRYTKNECEEKFRNDEEFLKIELSQPNTELRLEPPRISIDQPPPTDKSTPHLFLAQHTFWDLDGDGYEEPYIIVVHYATKKVVRITARWDIDGIKMDDKNKIVRIKPIEYFTAFPFIPNPDGSIYALGFGLLLGPLNESCNTLINQLVDAGTLNNLQAGFIGKGLRIKVGMSTFQPGEWKVVNATGDDLSKSIFPLPTKEPSEVLLNLLNMLITSGNQLASIAEIFVGKMPGQNTPATTTQETIQQGMAVFTAIYKRVYRSLAQEFKKIYRLNKLDPASVQMEGQLAGIQLQASDYDLPDWIVIPGADPVGDSSTVKMAKLQQVSSLVQMGTINTQVLTKRILDANEIPNPQELIAPPQPPAPDPKAATEQAKQQTIQMKGQMDQQKGTQQIQIAAQKAQLAESADQQRLAFEQQKQAMELQGAQSKQRMDQLETVMNQHMEAVKSNHEVIASMLKHHIDLQITAQSHNQNMAHKEASHKQDLAQAKAQEAAKPKAKE